MNKYLGPSSRFGDGDGSFWDRWLTTTGHFTEQGSYAKADMPNSSMYSTGVVRAIEMSVLVSCFSGAPTLDTCSVPTSKLLR